MAGRIRRHDWRGTPLGPIVAWPQSLRTAVDLMLDAPQAACIAWSPELISLYNEAYAPLLGERHPESLGKPSREVWGELWEEFRPIAEATLKGEAQHFLDRPVPLPGQNGGPAGWFTFSWTPLRDEVGEIAGFFCLATDMTEDVIAEEERRQSDRAALDRPAAELNRFFDLSQEILAFAWWRDGRWSRVNPAFTRTLDWREGELRETPFFNLVHPDDLERSRRATAEVAGGRDMIEFECRMRRRDGSYRWISWTASPSPEHGVMFCVGRDVTERREMGRSLRESEERLRAALKAARMANWFWDPVTDTLSASETYAELFGVPPENVWESSARFYRLVHPDDREKYESLVETAGRAGNGWDVEFRAVRPRDGRVVWLEERANPVADPATGRVMITGLTWDVTGRREAEDALRESESNARLLLAELQHRVRNTLAVIRSIAARTADTSESVDDFQMHLDGRIGAFARVQSSVTRDPGRGVDLATLLANELSATMAHEGRQVTLDGPEVRLPAKAAETLALAFHELATNAVKHGALSTRGGHIRVDWALAPGNPPALSLQWKETGLEMPESAPARRGFGTELLERLLPYQLDARTAQGFEADGLRCTIELPLPA